MNERRFNPYTDPSFLRSLEQEKLRKTQRTQVEQRRSFVADKLAEAQEVANKLHTPIQYILLDRGSVIVTPKNEDVLPQVNQTQNQQPNGQK